MLRKIIMSAVFCAFIAPVFAQTTQDEYNYMVKGYKSVVEAGMDAKAGYDLDKIPTIDDGNYSFEFLVLKRSATKDVAGIICVAKSKVWGNTYYLGIPVGNPDLFKLYYTDLEKWDKPMIQAYAKYSSILMGSFVGAIYDLKNEQDDK